MELHEKARLYLKDILSTNLSLTHISRSATQNAQLELSPIETISI